MENKKETQSGLLKFISSNFMEDFHSADDFEIKIKAKQSKIEELKGLATKDAIPKELLEWIGYQNESKQDSIAEVLSRILIYISPKNSFEPKRINNWLRKGKLPNHLSNSIPSSMTYIFSDVLKANKLRLKILKLNERVSKFDAKEPSKRTTKAINSAEVAAAESEVATESLQSLNLLIIGKLKEIEAILGSGGSL